MAHVDRGTEAPPNKALAKPVLTSVEKRNEGKPGRKPKFTSADDIVIAREVAAAKAHIAPYGETKQRFKSAADNANRSAALSTPVTAKSIQDRYKKIQDLYDRGDNKNSMMSGVGGEVTELEELLGEMREARDDLGATQDTEREAVREAERRKETAGNALVQRSLTRRASCDSDTEVIEIVDNDRRGKKRKASVSPEGPHQSGLAAFGDALHDCDTSRIELERQRFDFEKHRFQQEVKERAADRLERREERKEQNEFDLKKFQMMFEMMKRHQKD